MGWTSTRKELPPEGELVETRIADQYGVRNQKPLIRTGKIWSTADGVQMFYTPTQWRPIDQSHGASE